MIASGTSPKVVTQRLGHAHVSITLQLYARVLPAHDQAAADAVGAAIDGLRDQSVTRDDAGGALPQVTMVRPQGLEP